MAPRDFDYLFVLTYGRSGSTLLQGVLNSIPGYLIRGENRQVLRHLHRIHTDLSAERAKARRWVRKNADGRGELPSTRPWFGADGYPRRQALAEYRGLALRLVLRPEADTRVTGFKEIRWQAPDVADYVAWLRQVFPGARFVLNTRDLDAVAASAWWADRPDARGELEAVERRLLALTAELGEDGHHVRYDDYVADQDALRPLFAWLGEDYDADRIRDVLATPHSYRPKGQGEPSPHQP